jgi:hypothetical protein
LFHRKSTLFFLKSNPKGKVAFNLFIVPWHIVVGGKNFGVVLLQVANTCLPCYERGIRLWWLCILQFRCVLHIRCSLWLSWYTK